MRALGGGRVVCIHVPCFAPDYNIYAVLCERGLSFFYFFHPLRVTYGGLFFNRPREYGIRNFFGVVLFPYKEETRAGASVKRVFV